MTDLDLCQLSNEVYDNPNVVAGPAAALVTELDGVQVFVFAGSKDAPDFFFDGCAIPASMEGLGHVHKGFRDQYFLLRERLLKLAIDSPLPKVMCGHSLGGPQAQFCAWDFSRIMNVQPFVTFGCPRGFTAEAMANYNVDGRNYIHGQDMVPDLPGYFHRPGTDIFMDELGNPLSCREATERPFEEIRDKIRDHLLTGLGYLIAVDNFLKNST